MPKVHLNLTQCKGIILTVDSDKVNVPVSKSLCPYTGVRSGFLCSNEKTGKEQAWFTLLLTLCFKMIKYSIHNILEQGHCISMTCYREYMALKAPQKCHLFVLHTYVCMDNLMYWIRRSLITLTGSPGSPGGPCGPGGPSLPWKERKNKHWGSGKLLRGFYRMKIHHM